MTTFIIRVPSSIKDKYLVIKSVWRETDFSLFIYYDSTAFNCDVTLQSLQLFADQLKVSPDAYYDELKHIFSNANNSKFVFIINDNQLKIQRVIENCNLKQKYAVFKLKPGNLFELIESVTDTFFNERSVFENQVETIKSKNCDLEEKNKILMERTDHLSEQLLKQEQELISKFLLLLNEKKDRICQLYEIIEDHLAVHQCPCKNKEISKKNLTLVQDLAKPSTSRESFETISKKPVKSDHAMSDTENEDSNDKSVSDLEDNDCPTNKSKLILFDTQELFGDDVEHVLPKRQKLDEQVMESSEVKINQEKIKRNPDSLELQFEIDDYINDL